MVKKKISIGLFALALVGGYGYHTYAATNENDQQQTQVTNIDSSIPVANQTTVETPLLQGTPDPDAVNISEVPENQIFVPQSVTIGNAGRSINSTSIMTESEIYARETDIGLLLRTTYTTPENVEITFTQGPALLDEEGTIENLISRYNGENIKQTQINGHSAIVVDGTVRKVVHLITKDHLFSASSLNGTVDDLMNVINQVQE
ncbi:hypothetical protein A8990_11976 [Paenibacillus taihuensis]|uniref:Uncharacterized protein n=1 Tax=Paenibacillus taihuensis TaxID=1156355 RepID=A0A3D9RU20_9BACL|nr:hypothetical protein [Paenibacillus taihuensis]REE81241.1 hypothetical protein A8990_11976 [Paenibacillus taihuensis]